MLRFFIIPLVISALLFSQTGMGQVLNPNDPRLKRFVNELYKSIDYNFKNNRAFHDNLLYHLGNEGAALANKQNLDPNEGLALSSIKELIRTGNISGVGMLGRKILFGIIFPLGIIHRAKNPLVNFLDRSMRGIDISDTSARVLDLEKIKDLLRKIEVLCPVDEKGEPLELEDAELLSMLWQDFYASFITVSILDGYFNNYNNTGSLNSKSEKINFFEIYVSAQQNIVKRNTQYALFYKELYGETKEYDRIIKDLQINIENLKKAERSLAELKRIP